MDVKGLEAADWVVKRRVELQGELDGLVSRIAGVKRDLEGWIRELERAAWKAERLAAARSRPRLIDEVRFKVAVHFGYAPADLDGRRRTAALAWTRQVAMAMARQLTGLTMEEIGREFGGRTHGAVKHACEAVRNRLETEPDRKRDYEYLMGKIGGRV